MDILFETDRLLLRPLLLEDTDAMFAMDNNPNVHKYLWQSPTQTKVETIKIIEMVQNHSATLHSARPFTNTILWPSPQSPGKKRGGPEGKKN